MSLDVAASLGIALVGFVFSSLFSGAETGMYTLNRVRLAVRVARGERAALRLKNLLDNPNAALSVLLIGNNASNYLASYGLAAALHQIGLDDWRLIIVEAAVFTPILFIFAETLPKDLFRTHTDRWTYVLSGPLVGARWLFMACGLLPVINGFGTIATRLLGAGTDKVRSARQHVSQLIKEGVGAGLLTESQTTLADRALAMRTRTVADEMVAWVRVVRVRLRAGRADREVAMRKHPFSRFPVVDAGGRPVGVISLLQSLVNPDATTEELTQPPVVLSPKTPVHEALSVLREQRQPMAIVMQPDRSRPLGIVTIKDLVEPITGELAGW